MLAWVVIFGFVVSAPLAAVQRPAPAAGQIGWLAVAGAGNVIGLLLVYAAYRSGKVGVIAPIVSTEGAVAALLAILGGESLSVATGMALTVIALGVLLAAKPSEGDAAPAGRPAHGTILAGCAALCFGAGLYATGRIASLPLGWAVIPARAVGVLAIAIPLIALGRLTVSRRALPLVATSGVAEVAGFASFALGARHGIAIAAVIASLFAALAVVGAWLLFHERLGRVQRVGVATIAVGVAVVSALHP